MSDEDEMEEFGMNEEDMNRMFNPGGSRRHKISKDEAMLGIWANDPENSSNDDDDEDGFSYRNQKKKSMKGVSFVSGSKLKPGEEKPKKDVDPLLAQPMEDEFENKRANKVRFLISFLSHFCFSSIYKVILIP